MTLYLAGKSIDSKLVIASDGRSLRNSDHRHSQVYMDITSDDYPKFVKIRDRLYAAFSGVIPYTERLESILGTTYDDYIEQKEIKGFTRIDSDIFQEQALKNLEDYMNKRYADDFMDEGMKNMHASGHTFTLTDNGGVRTSYFDLNSKQPFTTLDGSDPNMNFPFRLNGVDNTAKEIILFDMMRNGTDYSSEYLKGLFLYILEETSHFSNGVGGTTYVGELNETGISYETGTALLEVDLVSEKIKSDIAKFGSPYKNPKWLRSLSHIIEYTSISFKDHFLPARLADNALKMYEEENDKDILESALVFYDVFANFNEQMVSELDEFLRVHLMFGKILSEEGKIFEAANSYNSVLSAYLRSNDIFSRSLDPSDSEDNYLTALHMLSKLNEDPDSIWEFGLREIRRKTDLSDSEINKLIKSVIQKNES